MLVAGLLGALLPAATAAAAEVARPALPVERLLTIQPYQVCNDAGTACAPVTFLPQHLAVANAILNQAGIGVAAAPVVRLNASAYLNPTTNNTNFDNLRDLLRLPQNAPATVSPTTLNVYFVNTLTNVANPARPTNFYGFGFIGGNGAVLATGRDAAGRTAAGDTLAHELAHNLGLPHPEDRPARPATQVMTVVPRPGAPPAALAMPFNDPRNLMRSVGRAVVDGGNICAVPPYTCATGALPANGRGVLVTEQINALRAPPIFTQLPLVAASATPTVSAGVVTRADTSVGFVTFNPALPGIASVSFRFRNQLVFPFTAAVETQDPSGNYVPATVQTQVGPNSEVRVDLRNPLIAAGQALRVVFAGTPDAALPDGLQPYSTQYNFVNGITSRSGFDATGFGSTALGFTRRSPEFGFDPTAPDVPRGPSFLPRDLGLVSPITGLPVEAFIDHNWSTPADLAAIPLPFAAFEPPPSLDFPGGLTGVALPPALLLFAPAALGLLALRRRRAA